MPRDWPHAPLHRLAERGAYMVTAGTYDKAHLLAVPEHRSMVQDMLLDLASECGWALQAWTVMANHYHFIAITDQDPSSLPQMLRRLHAGSATTLNRLDGTAGRQVWFQYWDTHLTFERSYLARLHYVHQNPVHHGVVKRAVEYDWCSANWFALHAESALRRKVESFPIDRVNVRDDF